MWEFIFTILLVIAYWLFTNDDFPKRKGQSWGFSPLDFLGWVD